MSKKPSAKTPKSPVPGFTHQQSFVGVDEYVLKRNQLRVLHCKRPGTGVITSNIVYLVGAVDESPGETGIAHMLEHMMFKPTTHDRAAGITAGGAMQFEREIGCILNASTWKDRTKYFFSYPVEHLDRALRLEAERMTGLVLTDEELKPEQRNVLSEFDMYNGDPHFALAVDMVATAFHSHPYGHETIGFRPDIEDYTAEKLERFYHRYYRPDNAVLMIIGDIDAEDALKAAKKHFAGIPCPDVPITRHTHREPPQEGIRRVSIERPSTQNLVSLGFKHSAFPSQEWFTTALLLEVLAEGPESILHTALVDSGQVSSLDTMIEYTKDVNLGLLTLTLAPEQEHTDIEAKARELIKSADPARVKQLLKNAKAKYLTDELLARDNSLKMCVELTEFIASGQVEAYGSVAELIKSVTYTDLQKMSERLFANQNLTIGYFIGT